MQERDLELLRFFLKLNIHKRVPFGVEETAERMAAFYGLPVGECLAVIDGHSGDVRQTAERLLRQHGLMRPVRPCTIAFIGDSLTSERGSFMRILQRMLEGVPQVVIVDASVTDDKSSEALMKLHQRVLAHRPGLVHILLGTNDMRRNADRASKTFTSHQEYADNMRCIIQTLQDHGARVMVSTIPPVRNAVVERWFAADAWTFVEDDIDICNRKIAELALELGAILNDMRPVYAQYEKEDFLSPDDGLHLNAFGQQLMAEALYIQLRQVLETEEQEAPHT